MLEALQATLLERVEAHHLGTALDRLAQRFEHARVVGAGVLADDEDRVGFLRSSNTTVPLPTPRDSPMPTPLASWHMFEQSGKLLVPKARTNSWYRNAASLLARPEV